MTPAELALELEAGFELMRHHVPPDLATVLDGPERAEPRFLGERLWMLRTSAVIVSLSLPEGDEVHLARLRPDGGIDLVRYRDGVALEAFDISPDQAATSGFEFRAS